MSKSNAHRYNSNGFCINCGWNREFIARTGRACSERAETEQIAEPTEEQTSTDQKRNNPVQFLQNWGNRVTSPPLTEPVKEKKEPRLKKGSLDSVNFARVFGMVFLIVIIICFLASLFISTPKSNQNGTYNAAMEKLNKGLPLNEREAQAVDQSLDASGKNKAAEIERRNGEK